MWFTTTAEGVQGWFVIQDKDGLLYTGQAANVTITVVEPGDSATSSPTVSESASKGGLYTFTVPDAFLTTHGVGIYAVVLEFNDTKLVDTRAYPLRVTTYGQDDIGPNTGLIPALL